MKRREFLSLCGLAAGSCLISSPVARLIRETCILSREPYLVLPRNPSTTLYAMTNGGLTDFVLHLGDPCEEQRTPTWREYLDEYEGIDVRDKETVEKWWREHVGDPEEDPVTIVAEEEIDGWALENWEFRQEVYDGPMAGAYRWLEQLPLDDKQGPGRGGPLGRLGFVEGDRPGSNLTYVEAPDLATLACASRVDSRLGQRHVRGEDRLC